MHCSSLSLDMLLQRYVIAQLTCCKVCFSELAHKREATRRAQGDAAMKPLWAAKDMIVSNNIDQTTAAFKSLSDAFPDLTVDMVEVRNRD